MGVQVDESLGATQGRLHKTTLRRRLVCAVSVARTAIGFAFGAFAFMVHTLGVQKWPTYPTS